MRELISHSELCNRLEKVRKDKAAQLISCPLEEVVEIRQLIKGLNIAEGMVKEMAEEG